MLSDMRSVRSTARALAGWAKHNKLDAVRAVVLIVFVPVGVYQVFTSLGVLPAALTIGGLMIVWTADVMPRQFAAFSAENWQFFSVIIGVVTFVTLREFTDRTGSGAFYEASAQVIPVLLLAMALEVRLLPDRLTGSDLRMGMLLVYLLAGGEFAALQSIERGHGGETQFGFTVAGLVAGFIAVSLIAVSSRVDKPRHEGDE